MKYVFLCKSECCFLLHVSYLNRICLLSNCRRRFPSVEESLILLIDLIISHLFYFSQVSIKGGAKIVDGEFYNRIIVDDSFWTLEDGEVVLNLQKDNKMEWWKCVVKGDPEINTQKV